MLEKQSKHKSKKYNIFTKTQKKRTQAYYKRKPSNHKRKNKKKKKKYKINWKKYKINWKTRFKMAINTFLSIITLNVNGPNTLIKRHRVADWILAITL